MSFVNKNRPIKGDLIRVRRSQGYYHFGIALDENNVIHFTGPLDDSITNSETIKVRMTSLDIFLRGDKLEVQTPFDSTLTRDEIIANAKSYLGKSKVLGKNYNLLTNNCEHFARYCYYNKNQCKQIKDITIEVTKTAAAVARTAIVNKVKNKIKK